ncbi:MAG: hypothetical protein Q8L07_11495 [Sediminibacterium sp.]|nr:hypothetical protein [Sediminibacterium sp.]
MKKIIVLLITFLSVYQTYSQRNIYIGEKKYFATDEWDFNLVSSEDFYFKNIQLSVLKKGISRYLMLSYPARNGTAGNRIFIVLENDETITLTQKVITDDVDHKNQVLYSISQLSYKKLKESDISRIRFAVEGESYTADNQHTVRYEGVDVFGNKDHTYHDVEEAETTAEQIRKLDDFN